MKNSKGFKNLSQFNSKVVTLMTTVVFGSALLMSGEAVASAAPAAATTAKQLQALQSIISRGDQEITQRLTTLGTLSGKINGTTQLSAADKTSLDNEVSGTIGGLTILKTQLDADTTASTATANVQSIYTDYWVYAFLLPKLNIIRAAATEQVEQSALTTSAQSLQTNITTAQQAGKNVTTAQNELSDMVSKTNAAQAISSNVENTAVSLQASDYNSDHQVLSGYSAQLKTARTDDQAAYTDAKNIVSALKNK